MIQTPWRLESHDARLELRRLAAALDLTQPDRGLSNLRIEDLVLSSAHLLGVQIPAFMPDHAIPRLESYTRGNDVSVTYQEGEEWPVRVDAVWRALPSIVAPAEVLAAVDLILSVRTDLLDTRPELAVRSTLPAAQVLRLIDASSGRGQVWRSSRDLAPTISAQEGPGCLVFRLPGERLSYVEMVHPADFQRSDLASGAGQDPSVVVRHRLFTERLEKGVILRARVRGAVVAQHLDLDAAASLYAAFAVTDPPLGT